ncbi:hypothetical protein FBQ99_20945 [Chloroflexi bacterium CFX2]|nr:hypothetical protein [Chloroflexi bacterium CFX2]
MDAEPLAKFWALIRSLVRILLEITEPRIEDAAVGRDIPIELYYFSELGLEHFSVGNFQKRDPFTNPEQFKNSFARFDLKGWIVPLPDDRYEVSPETREAVRRIISDGDARLAEFDRMPESELKRLVDLLEQIASANLEAPEPPEKWAILHRFRVADGNSPLIVQLRELLMDLFAYRDDSHLSAAHPHFGRAGIVWSVLGSICDGDAVNAKQMVEKMDYRGYEEEDYEVAIQAAVQIGWVEAADAPYAYRPTSKGREIREQAERLTDEYFFRPWSVLTEGELDELYALLSKLRGQLIVFRKAKAS